MATINDIKGKVVALTGDKTVGYGTAGGAVFGIVQTVPRKFGTTAYEIDLAGVPRNSATFKVDAATMTALGVDDGADYVITVINNVYSEEVPQTTTAANRPAVGDYVTVDGKGGVQKATVVADKVSPNTAMCVSLNGTTDCTIKIY